jgi:hypothetical protein
LPAVAKHLVVPPGVENREDPPFINVVNGGCDGINIIKAIHGRYEDDKFFQTVMADLELFWNFEYVDKVLYLKVEGQKVLCIRNVIYGGHNIHEGHSLLAHLGPQKTLLYLHNYDWWKDLTPDIVKFCDLCMTCWHSKPSMQNPYEVLNTLDVPQRPWESIGIDFVGLLPESLDRNATYNSITVIIDFLSGIVHLVPS